MGFEPLIKKSDNLYWLSMGIEHLNQQWLPRRIDTKVKIYII